MSAPAPAPLPRGRILAVTGAAHALAHMADDVLQPLLAALGQPLAAGGLGFSARELGRLGAVQGGLYGLMALPAGILTAAGYGRGLLVLTMGCAGLAALTVAGTSTPLAFAVAVALVGVGAGIYHPPGLTTVAQITERRGRALAFHGIAGNLGIAATPLLALLLPFGWRPAFLLLGVAAIGTAVLAGTLPRVPGARGAGADRSADGGPIWVPFFLTIALLFLGGFALKAVKFFLQHHVQEDLAAAGFAVPPELGSGALVAAAYLMGAFGQRRGGRLLDGWGADRVFALAMACTGGACFVMAVTPGALVVLPAGVFAYCYFMGQSPSNELIARFIGPRWRGLGFGIHFSVSFGLGSAGAELAGWAAESGRLWVAFVASGVACLVTAGASATLLRRDPRARAALEGAAR